MSIFPDMSNETRTGFPSLYAASAQAAATAELRVSFAPNPPPNRRTSTFTLNSKVSRIAKVNYLVIKYIFDPIKKISTCVHTCDEGCQEARQQHIGCVPSTVCLHKHRSSPL